MITNKDIRVENGFLIINGDKYPLDGQSPEAIMAIVEDNSDTTPTENSTAPITSGGVYTALGGKEDTLTFDEAPTASSDNPVKSDGIKTYVDTAVNKLDKGFYHPVASLITATTEDDFLLNALKDIKTNSNSGGNASVNAIYVWSGHDQYVFFGFRVNTAWIYALVYSYDRAYILEFNVANEVISVKKTFTLT